MRSSTQAATRWTTAAGSGGRTARPLGATPVASGLSSSRAPRRNRSTRVDTAEEVVGRNSHNSHKGNRAVMRLRSRRWRRLRPRPPLRQKTDRAHVPTTHSLGSALPMPSRRRLPTRLERCGSVSCHHPEAYCPSDPTLPFTPGESPGRRRPGRREATTLYRAKQRLRSDDSHSRAWRLVGARW